MNTSIAPHDQTVLVRGSGDIASAVACRLFQHGYPVTIHESETPAATRRGMAFADAVFGGEPVLEDVRAVRYPAVDSIGSALRQHQHIPVGTVDFEQLHCQLKPEILIDARMRKRAVPEDMRALARLTIGLGPNFVAGGNCHVAIETSWEDLGRVITAGPTLEFRGDPRAIGGAALERYVYAPSDGVFRTAYDIGDQVEQGQVIATVGGSELKAPLYGTLRGLTHDGVPVTAGTKVIEVDPRELDAAAIRGIAERPEKIAAGVVQAVNTMAGRSTIEGGLSQD